MASICRQTPEVYTALQVSYEEHREYHGPYLSDDIAS